MLLDTCPNGWHRLDNAPRCFKLVETPETYDNAIDGCNSLQPGATLAYVDSEEVHDFFVDTVLGDFSNWVYVGLKDQIGDDADASHVWLKTGKSVDYYQYSNWAPGKPGGLVHRCVVYQRHVNYLPSMPDSWYWQDVLCSFVLAYMCEIGTVSTNFNIIKVPINQSFVKVSNLNNYLTIFML